MTRLRAISVAVGEGAEARASVDCVTLAYEQRYRRRGVLRADAGLEFLLDLPEATELRDGDALLLEDGRRIRIRSAVEPLTAVTAQDARHLARLSWHIGNRHLPAAVEESRILIQPDHVIEAMLIGLGARLAPVSAPFHPEGGAYGHGRTHAHGHAPHAHADPNAHIQTRLSPSEPDPNP